jgi:hypothetical protein
LTEAIDLTKVLSGYEGQWVILSLDNSKVVASGRCLEDITWATNLGLVILVPTGFPCTFSLIDLYFEGGGLCQRQPR